MLYIDTQDVLHAHPDYSKHFDVHTDASNKISGVISQEGNPLHSSARSLIPHNLIIQ